MECRRNGGRLGLECDGETYHYDEHGDLKMEDLERQAVLERAGWTIERIPYRRWRDDPDAEVDRILERLDDLSANHGSRGDGGGDPNGRDGVSNGEGEKVPSEPGTDRVHLFDTEYAVFQSVKGGAHLQDDVLRAARAVLQNHHGKGFAHLGSRIKRDLLSAASNLQKAGLIVLEEDEYFVTSSGRKTTPAIKLRELRFRDRRTTASTRTARPVKTRRRGSSKTARSGRTTQSSFTNKCSDCGRRMVIRNGRYGKFLGCTGYPRCRNTVSLN